MAIDLDGLVLSLVAGLAGALIGAFVAGRYAIEAVRRQSLHGIKQDAYNQTLPIIDEIVSALETMDEILATNITDPAQTLESLSDIVSPALYFGGVSALERLFGSIDKSAAEVTDEAGRQRFLIGLRQGSISWVSFALINEVHKFEYGRSKIDLAEPSDDVAKFLGKALDALRVAMNAMGQRVINMGLGTTDKSKEDQFRRAMKKAGKALGDLRTAMVLDLQQTLG
jgi:hypothetical protein